MFAPCSWPEDPMMSVREWKKLVENGEKLESERRFLQRTSYVNFFFFQRFGSDISETSFYMGETLACKKLVLRRGGRWEWDDQEWMKERERKWDVKVMQREREEGGERINDSL